MKGVINEFFPTDSRARRRKALVSESQERILTSPSHISPLQRLGKTSDHVCCPYCKQTTQTRVERSDSKTTKGVNALLWMGMGDPFALTAHDWCQNTDHFCTKCNKFLAHKPYRGQTQAIPEDSVWELPHGKHHERTELASDPNHVSELEGDRKVTVHYEADKEAMGQPRHLPTYDSRITHPAELSWEFYEPSLSSHDQSSVLTEANETQPLKNSPNTAELPEGRFQLTPELENPRKIKRKPVPLGSGGIHVQNPDSESLKVSSNLARTAEPQSLSSP